MRQKGKTAMIGLVVVAVLLVGGFAFAKAAPQGSKANSCADTDGGIVLNVVGTTSGYFNRLPYSHTDFCTDASNVNEYYCSGTLEQSTVASCGTDFYGANYCINSSVYHDFTDYGCATGACGSTTTPQFVETCAYGCNAGACNNPPADSCSDTDGGMNIFTQGTVSGYLNGNAYSNSDFCVDSTMLSEYYCSGARAYALSFGCANNLTTTCSNGACI